MERHGNKVQLVGNRIMLTGAVLYLLEWVAIIWAGALGVQSVATVGASEADILASYQGNADAVAVMAGWFSVVLLGRILLMVGLKASLVASGRPHPLMGFAVVAMSVSVVVEIAAYALAAAAAQLGAAHTEGMVAVEWAAGMLNRMLMGGLGVSVLCAAWAMWRSGLFPRVLSILGLIAGVGVTLGAMFVAPSFAAVYDILGSAAFLFWIWMLWAGVLLWIRTPKRAAVVAEEPVSAI